MGLRLHVVLAGLVAAFSLGAVPAGAESYAVVTNADNTARDVDAATLRRLYLKEQAEWPGGRAAKPFGRPATSGAHKALLENVLRMDQDRLTRHWISLKQRTGQRSVLEVDSDAKLQALLQRFPGAFGVLPLALAEADPRLHVLLRLP